MKSRFPTYISPDVLNILGIGYILLNLKASTIWKETCYIQHSPTTACNQER